MTFESFTVTTEELRKQKHEMHDRLTNAAISVLQAEVEHPDMKMGARELPSEAPTQLGMIIGPQIDGLATALTVFNAVPGPLPKYLAGVAIQMTRKVLVQAEMELGLLPDTQGTLEHLRRTVSAEGITSSDMQALQEIAFALRDQLEAAESAAEAESAEDVEDAEDADDQNAAAEGNPLTRAEKSVAQLASALGYQLRLMRESLGLSRTDVAVFPASMTGGHPVAFISACETGDQPVHRLATYCALMTFLAQYETAAERKAECARMHKNGIYLLIPLYTVDFSDHAVEDEEYRQVIAADPQAAAQFARVPDGTSLRSVREHHGIPLNRVRVAGMSQQKGVEALTALESGADQSITRRLRYATALTYHALHIHPNPAMWRVWADAPFEAHSCVVQLIHDGGSNAQSSNEFGA